ncbi:MAG: cupin [Actinobacteria bacterium]|nr:cupin [Actinomycetota bacterium]MBV9936400.1 cupin [Actinomycetota bacterium]
MTERTLGGVGTKVVFENDRVRIWELKLAPREKSDVHRHDLDHILVLVSGDRIAVQPEPDTGGPYKDYLAADVIPGMAVFVERGGVETAINVGDEPYVEVIVELKD